MGNDMMQQQKQQTQQMQQQHKKTYTDIYSKNSNKKNLTSKL